MPQGPGRKGGRGRGQQSPTKQKGQGFRRVADYGEDPEPGFSKKGKISACTVGEGGLASRSGRCLLHLLTTEDNWTEGPMGLQRQTKEKRGKEGR